MCLRKIDIERERERVWERKSRRERERKTDGGREREKKLGAFACVYGCVRVCVGM